VIGRLEAKGYIARRPSETDSRAKLLSLTARGRALVDAATPAVERAQTRMLAPLSGADRRALLRLLARLVDLNHKAVRPPRRADKEAKSGTPLR
jgi:DNA-binding MarR family transcriptional regulator